jgi:hypothetical protein
MRSLLNEVSVEKTGTKKAVFVAALCALIPLACLAVPVYVIRPFVPQNGRALAVALGVRQAAPGVSAVCAAIALAAMVRGWRRSQRTAAKTTLVILFAIALTAAWGTRINIFEKMFHPYDSPAFAPAAEVPIETNDMVLSVSLNGEARAYPVRTMGYHHVVNDTVGNVPIAVTYCTLCHAGLVWHRELDGKTLHFRLAGINNGNALLRDEQTGTIWQQSTGEAIFGPLKGRHLDIIPSDELTFALWRAEQPHGLVLKPDPAYVAEYDPKDWESHIAKTHAVVDTSASGIDPHRLMFGVTVQGHSKAYPVDVLLHAKVVEDESAEVPLLILAGPDGASVRVFDARGAAGRPLTFATDGESVRDAETGSTWNFQGCATAGTMANQCLKELESHKDYWFDWMNHHPGTSVFRD